MRTRFAPSPTGYLHLGHAFAALTAYEAAAGDAVVLRIEDIDIGRCRAEFETALLEDLAWLGLRWQQPVRRQSEHFDDYAAALALLQHRGVIYPCFCTRKEIAAEIARAADAPHRPDGARYPGTCRGLSDAARTARMAARPYALRLDLATALVQIDRSITFQEDGRGPTGEHGLITAQPACLGDVVLARKALPVSYHLAVVVDDALQGIELVTRGEDLFHATPIQRVLQELLGLPAPRYAHHRLILDEQGRKFSKRDKAVTLRSLREAGMTPAEIRSRIGKA